MPLLDQGRPVADPFVAVPDDAPLPSDSPALIPYARWRAEAAVLHGRNAPLGIRVPSATPAEELAGHLDGVAMVAVEFPKFRDGRGFTIARALRERHGFSGEIRAVGHVLPDQHVFLLRCGFTTVAVPDGADLAPWQAALARYHTAYQASVAGEKPLAGMHRRLTLGG